MKFSSDHIKVQKKENRLPPLLNGDYRRKRYYVGDANIQLLVLIYLWITISHFSSAYPPWS